MFAKADMELRKQRINGPFKRVTYIDPYPDNIFRILSCPLNTSINIIAQLFFLLIISFVVIGSHPIFASETAPLFLSLFSVTAYEVVTRAAQNLNMERVDFVVDMVFLNIFFGLACVEYSNWYRRRLVVKKWWDRCIVVPAVVIDSEIQDVYLTDPDDIEEEIHTVSKPYYMLRVKVKFEYGNHQYEATPSIFNRINPDALGLYFETEKECQELLEKHKQSLNIEVNPENPIDCEIQGYLLALLRHSRQPWLPILIFGASVFVFSQLFIKLISV